MIYGLKNKLLSKAIYQEHKTNIVLNKEILYTKFIEADFHTKPPDKNSTHIYVSAWRYPEQKTQPHHARLPSYTTVS